jgi:pimeloyl-ACP methyl ester carboxylesterase
MGWKMMRGIIVAAAFAALTISAKAERMESNLDAPGPLGPLMGTMVAAGPAGAPIVLIIPGSGPTDRDGNSPLGVNASTYRLLAEALAERGVSSVRIDKRGMFASAGAVSDANAVTISDYAADVRSWISAIRAKTGASCVWVLGHSEGGLVALAAAKDTRDICGIVLVAAAGRPLAQIIRSQLRANPANAPLLDQAMKAIDSLEAGKRVDITNMNPALLPLFRPQVQGFLIDQFSYDPAKLIASYAGPVLIVQGENDIQVAPEDAQLLKAANPRAKLVLLPGVNHVLKQVSSDDRGANVATYADRSLPLAGTVAEPIAAFILQAH